MPIKTKTPLTAWRNAPPGVKTGEHWYGSHGVPGCLAVEHFKMQLRGHPVWVEACWYYRVAPDGCGSYKIEQLDRPLPEVPRSGLTKPYADLAGWKEACLAYAEAYGLLRNAIYRQPNAASYDAPLFQAVRLLEQIAPEIAAELLVGAGTVRALDVPHDERSRETHE